MNQDFDQQTVAGRPQGDYLRVRRPGAAPQLFMLLKGQTVLGRSPECDLVLDDDSVSRRHAVVERQGQDILIRDLGSANGLVLAGRQVESAVLRPGETVLLGVVEVALESSAPGDAAQPSAGQATVMRASPLASAAPPSGGGGGKSRWLFLVDGLAALGVLALVMAVSLLGGGKKEQVPSPPASAPAPAAPRPATPAAPPSPPVDDSKAAAHLRDGQTYHEAGRLLDAAQEWRRALEIDPGLQAARGKLERVEQEIMQKAEEAYRRGLTSFQYLDYEKAIQNWLVVQSLLPDPQHPLHQKAADYIAQARAKLGR
ncbi:MAG: FHA domain-containing protein [Desulfarculus sp.]|nr:FHA domain-containing protein [Desulfarculus sp.]